MQILSEYIYFQSYFHSNGQKSMASLGAQEVGQHLLFWYFKGVLRVTQMHICISYICVCVCVYLPEIWMGNCVHHF